MEADQLHRLNLRHPSNDRKEYEDMRRYGISVSLLVWMLSGLILLGEPAAAQSTSDDETLKLAKQTQNPVADLISVPFQNNFNFGYGAKDAPEPSSTQYVLNIQPVVPIGIARVGT
jgi:hypothetical protein